MGRALRPDPVRRADGLPIRFLPRHGRGHKMPPSAINFRANIDALKRAGVTDLVSVSACGSLKERYRPAISCSSTSSSTAPSRARRASSARAASPTCRWPIRSARCWSEPSTRRCKAEDIAHTDGGTYLVMEGPQFSTRAESNLYRSWGCDVIGMTNMPEAKLAREAEICYATVAMVTDYDCWHEDHAEVDVAAVITVLQAQRDKAQRLVEAAGARFPARASALPDRLRPRARRRHHHAAAARDPALMKKLDAVAGRVLKG